MPISDRCPSFVAYDTATSCVEFRLVSHGVIPETFLNNSFSRTCILVVN